MSRGRKKKKSDFLLLFSFFYILKLFICLCNTLCNSKSALLKILLLMKEKSQASFCRQKTDKKQSIQQADLE